MSTMPYGECARVWAPMTISLTTCVADSCGPAEVVSRPLDLAANVPVISTDTPASEASDSN